MTDAELDEMTGVEHQGLWPVFGHRPPWCQMLGSKWREFIQGPDMPKLAVLPDGHEMGVYFLFSGDDLRYVGQTTYLPMRLKRHRRVGIVFTQMSIILTPGAVAPDVELAYIHALRPPLNKRIDTPRCSQHAEMMWAIRDAWGVPHPAPIAGR